MFQGLDRLNHAVQILVGRNATLNQRLYEAIHEFAAAMSHSDQWPGKMLAQADRIREKLTAKGRIDATVNGMDVAAASDIAEEILSLAIAMNTANALQGKHLSIELPSKQRKRRRRLDVSPAKG